MYGADHVVDRKMAHTGNQAAESHNVVGELTGLACGHAMNVQAGSPWDGPLGKSGRLCRKAWLVDGLGRPATIGGYTFTLNYLKIWSCSVVGDESRG